MAAPAVVSCPHANTYSTCETGFAGDASKSVSEASSRVGVHVRSRARCSAAAYDRAVPSGIGNLTVQVNIRPSTDGGWSLSWFGPRTFTVWTPGHSRTFTPAPAGASAAITVRSNVRSPGASANDTPASRATCPCSVASTTAFARTRWSPLRLAANTPAGRPSASFSTSHATVQVRNGTPAESSASSNVRFMRSGVTSPNMAAGPPQASCSCRASGLPFAFPSDICACVMRSFPATSSPRYGRGATR